MSQISSRMTMRAEVRRNSAAADAHGGAGKPAWTLIQDGVPCFVWSRVRQRVVDGKQNAEVEEIAVVFRAGADVLAFDRIEQIKDRRGRVLFAGPFDVLTGTEKSAGDGVDHLAFKLRRIA
ncbi:MAG: hypothetical protein PHS14_02875 [Elusimicrobia bacterium]|nr:hypothetical protein [Elusimicrobiota bacterium]